MRVGADRARDGHRDGRPSTPRPTPARFHVRSRRTARCRSAPGPPRETYLSVPRLLEAARAAGRRRGPPGLRLPVGERGVRAGRRGRGTRLGRPAARGDRGDGRQAPLARAHARRPACRSCPGSAPRPPPTTGPRAPRRERLGFPLLVKASAGGGGKGMSRVDRAGGPRRPALAEGRRARARRPSATTRSTSSDSSRAAATSSSRSSATRAGNVVHLFERECSVQRRHQKIVEETPSPALDAGAAARPWAEAAVAAGPRRRLRRRGHGRVPASTATRRFYFLEMNTRLQVEHPITEETLGIDLVRAQLEVAGGRPLPAAWRDGALSPRGHAIELRLYAEDPVDVPAALGTTPRLSGAVGPGVRVDAGVEEGSVVGVDYDPLLAKLVVSGGEPRRGDRARAPGARGVGRPRRRDEPAAPRRRARAPRRFARAATRPTSSSASAARPRPSLPTPPGSPRPSRLRPPAASRRRPAPGRSPDPWAAGDSWRAGP